MTTSETIGALAAALAAAQGKFPSIPKNKTARVAMKTGGTYTYNFADLADILDAVRPQLAANGLAILQPVAITGSQVTVRTRLCHSSGEWVEEELTMHAVDDRPQSLGAATTYGRRYALAGILGVSPDSDVDGEVQDVAPRAVPAKAEKPAKAASAKPAPTPARSTIPDPADLKARFAAAKSVRELLELVPLVKQLPEDVQEALRPAFTERQRKLAAEVA